MTPKQKASIKFNIKQKYLHGELTFDEYEGKVNQLQHLADIGASLQEANIQLGLSKKAAKAAAAAASAGNPTTPEEYKNLVKILAKKKTAKLITGEEQKQLMNKLADLYKKGTPLADIEKTIGCDPGTLATDKAIIKLGKELTGVYQDAAAEMQTKLADFLKKYGPEMKELELKFADGTIDAAELQHLKMLMLQKSIMGQKMDQLAGVMLNANQKAAAMINGEQLGVFADNANYQSYQITQDAKMDLMFSIYDESTVQKLIQEKPELLPPKTVNGKKDKAWNQKVISGAVLQSVIQGESIPQLARRIATQTGETNMKAMMRYARTAMTSAQNAGRMEMLHRAQGMGIKVKKVWLATLDGRTRDSHRHLDGQVRDVDKPFDSELGKIMFPGDPSAEPGDVYNCRCTLTYQYDDYPADPTNNQRIMYEEWDEEIPIKKKDKNGKEYEAKQIVHHRESKLINDMSYDEWHAAKEGSKLNDLNTAKYTLAEAQKAVIQAKIKEDKVYDGLWKDPVTLADYPAKKAGIPAKRDYYDQEIQKYKDAQNMGYSWATDDKIKELEKKKKLLDEYEKRGALIEKRDQAIKAVQDIYNQVGFQSTASAPAVAQKKAVKKAKKAVAASGGTSGGTAAQAGAAAAKTQTGGPFGPDAYSKERKDKALWSRDKGYVDGYMRDRTGEVWRGATGQERGAIYDYTESYSKFNEPLRGIEYGTSRYLGVGKTDLNAGHKKNGNQLNAMTDIIDKCSYDHDMWLQRGCRFSGMDKFLQCDMSLLQRGSEKQLQNELLGKTVTEYGFMSMGSAKGEGFSGDILFNIYAPAGTKMMYAEPFSAYGRGAQSAHWDGKSKQSSYGREFETIMQQNTQFRVTKVEKSGSQIYIDIEVIGQSEPQRWNGR